MVGVRLMALNVNVAGTWRGLAGNGVQVNVAGTWRTVNFGYVNVAGTWKLVYTNFNSATGGNSTTDVSDYLGTGQTWRVHVFTSSGTFSVSQGPQTFKYFVLGGGAGGGYGTGGGRGYSSESTVSLPTGNISVTVGAAVSGGYDETTNRDAPGNNGNPSSIDSYATAAGGVSRGDIVGDGATTTITGSSVSYGGSGGACSINNNSNIGGFPGGGTGATTGTAATLPGGGGGGGQFTSGGGARGEVVIAYRIS